VCVCVCFSLNLSTYVTRFECSRDFLKLCLSCTARALSLFFGFPVVGVNVNFLFIHNIVCVCLFFYVFVHIIFVGFFHLFRRCFFTSLLFIWLHFVCKCTRQQQNIYKRIKTYETTHTCIVRMWKEGFFFWNSIYILVIIFWFFPC